jgi:hypothetical protein
MLGGQAMKTYEFILKFSVPKNINDSEYTDKLFEAGCDDDLVGIGKKGYIALDFSRESENAYQAVSSAIKDVKRAIPDAKLIEVGPDFVGLTDIAQFLDCSRLNVRKLIINNIDECPPPIYDGTTSFWHLSKVLNWLKNKDYQIK